MRKKSVRFISLLCACLIAFSAAACNGDKGGDASSAQTASPEADAPVGNELVLTKTDACETYESVASSFQLTNETANDGTFSLADASIYRKGSGATLKSGTLSSIQLNKSLKEVGKTTIEFDLQIQGTPEKADYETLFIGLRLTDAAKQANSSTGGLWLAVKGNQIGMRKDAWPKVMYCESPVDFSTLRRMYIEDDPDTNVITVSANDDNGNKIEIFRVVIEDDGMISGYTPSSEKPSVRNKITSGVIKGGFFKLWLHHYSSEVIIENLTITGYEEKLTSSVVSDPLFLRDVFEDTWVATDDEGRGVGQNADGGISAGQVGMFYFLTAQNAGEYYDHTATYYGKDNGANGVTRVEALISKQGNHYWAQPYFGYYLSHDEWVIRKHAYMLNDAGVDFIFLDITNGITYTDTYEKIFTVYSEMREEGYNTPQIMFHCGYLQENITKSLAEIYSNLYSQERYKDLWFEWEGKPLVLAQSQTVSKMSDEIKDMFTFRSSWAYSSSEWYTDTDGKGCWPWADLPPQAPGLSPDGELEQMVVMSGYWANSKYGRSYANGRQPENSEFSFELTTNGTSGKGLAYQEQFDRALETDPSILMLIGWNEWSAGRHSTDQLKNDGQLIAGTYTVDSKHGTYKYSYIDCFSPEYSRDVEPVSGLFKDNYYYQTALNVREYKGTREIAGAFGQKTIDMAAGAEQWLSVGPEYRDYHGDVTHRNYGSAVEDLTYTNATGRNDFVTAKVSVDGDNVYFYAECANDITAPEGTNWMNLFIDSDCNASTGWYGYDYIINRSQNGGKASVEAFATTEKNAEWSVSSAGEAEYTVSGNTIVIKLPKSVVALGDTFDFKWADNSVADGKEIMQFIDLGDAAPNGRFNYRYTTADATVAAPSCLTGDMVVLKSNSYNAYAGGKQVMLDAASTKIVAVGEKGTVYLPLSFVTANLDIAENALSDKYTYAGTTYVAINSAIEAAGKKITVSDDGLIVIANEVIDNNDTLRALYRALM